MGIIAAANLMLNKWLTYLFNNKIILQAFYKASKQRFDADPEFKERAQQAVVSLQVNLFVLTIHN